MEKTAPVGNEREIIIGKVSLRFWLILPTMAHTEIKMQLDKMQKRKHRCTEWMPSAAILRKKKNTQKQKTGRG